MFNLERPERLIIIVLVSTLVLGLGVMVYKNSHRAVKIEIRHFNTDRSSSASNALININTATEEELARLKGVGKALAGRIVDHRMKNGLFLSKEDIKKVSGIGDALFDKIKDEITVE